ncbi:MAG: alpha/beta fold hydrolase [Gammaproteobacteria bacterium]|nr:alpha/beta fold hydrolase [Gammaproteobacteria bacterium]
MLNKSCSLIAIIVFCALAGTACGKPAPKSIDALRGMTTNVSLDFVRNLNDGPNFSAYLVSYKSAGLKVYAMVAVPRSEKPLHGYPVVVANHGHHPDPPKYGITADGTDSRPGDYYRAIPALFAAQGFLVVMPDYRGHSDSEGFEFTEGMLESSYYTEDVATLLAGLSDIEDADLDNVFMWGHSMGGEVTLRTLLVTERVRGATIWSTVGGEIWDQSYYYSRYENDLEPDGSDVPKSVIDDLRRDIAKLDGEFDPADVEPLFNLQYLHTPVIIHHSVGDRSAPYKSSERLARELYLRALPYEFYSYPGSDHLFDDETMRAAAARDVAFFQSLLTNRQP